MFSDKCSYTNNEMFSRQILDLIIALGCIEFFSSWVIKIQCFPGCQQNHFLLSSATQKSILSHERLLFENAARTNAFLKNQN